MWNLSLKMDCWWLARLNNGSSRAWSYPRPASQQVSQILWHLEHCSFARISNSDPPQAGQAGWHCFSPFFTFVSAMISLRSFSCWIFMGLALYFDDRSMERLTSIQLSSSMTLSPASRAAWLPLASSAPGCIQIFLTPAAIACWITSRVMCGGVTIDRDSGTTGRSAIEA